MNYLLGAAPVSPFHKIWRELGTVKDREILFYDLFTRIEAAGAALDVHCDAGRLAARLKDLAPEDERLVDKFVDGIQACISCAPPVDKPLELMTLSEKLRTVAGVFPLIRRKRVSLGEFAARFRSPLMREMFPLLRIMNSDRVPLGFRQMSLGLMHARRAGYPRCGALSFARAIEKRFTTLGGRIQYGARVERIVVRNDAAAAVGLSDGGEYPADYVISAADGRATIFDMLGGRYVNRRIRTLFESPVASSIVQVAVGVNMRFDDWPASMAGVIFPWPEKREVAGRCDTHLGVCIYSFAPELAPPGRTLLKAVIPSDYAWWKALATERAKYAEEKEKIRERVVAALDRRFPGLASKVEMCDVATPLSIERYTGNWQGSPQGWDLTTRNFMSGIGKTLPGLRNFYMAGQWVEAGGGICIVALSGRNAIQFVCRDEGREFRTSEA